MNDQVQSAVASYQTALLTASSVEAQGESVVRLRAPACKAALRLLWTECIERDIDVSTLHDDDEGYFDVHNTPRLVEAIDALQRTIRQHKTVHSH